MSKLKELTNVNIIDIREKAAYNRKHIKDAVNINFNDILINYEKYLNKNETYYIYCHSGIMSKQLCSILINKGYNTIAVTGRI